MKLIRLEFKDLYTGWRLRSMEFFPNLTLLVGVSGVGKTRILNAIEQLCDLCDGDPTWPIEWKVEFSIGKDTFLWEGSFENAIQPKTNVAELPYVFFSSPEETHPKIVNEKLRKNGSIVFERDITKITFNGKEMPKLSSTKSVIFSLSEEPIISPIAKAWKTLNTISGDEDIILNQTDLIEKRYDGFKDYSSEMYAEEIRHDTLSTNVKLLLASQHAKDQFNSVVEKFKEVFPQVEDVFYLRCEGRFNHWILHFKELGVEHAIPYYNCSAGMRRTLSQIAQLLLWTPETVILIDEIENSLGVNCINFITDEILAHSKEMQFIITSHHPYIINNIDVKHWKIVSRKGSRVSVKNASDYGLESSSHESFLKLMNLDDYTGGIAK